MYKQQWVYGKTAGHDTHGQGAVSDEKTGKSIAIVCDGKAHGDLIAAAPELLEALEMVYTSLQSWNDREEGGEDNLLYMFSTIVPDAIARAKGDSQ